MKRLMIIALLFAGTVFAQTANVIELDPPDTARAQKAWDALQKAQAEWDATRDSVGLRYAVTPGASIFSLNCGPIRDGGITCQHTRPGFENGFEFSKDFKYIVPKAAAPSTCIGSGCGSYLQYNNGITLTPGMGTINGGTFQ